MSDVDERRDLPEDRGGEYPAHIRVRSFTFAGTDLAAVLWLGSENSETSTDAMLTGEDVDWLIGVLQRIRSAAGEEPRRYATAWQGPTVGTWTFTAQELDLLGLRPGDRFGPGIVGPPRKDTP